MAKRSRQEKVEVVGLDLGDRWTSWCRCAPDGEVIDEGRVRTQAEPLRMRFGDGVHRRFFLETGTHSLWVARLLRSLGHEVHVLHARSLRLISESRRKTDRLDARLLAQLGATMGAKLLPTVDVMPEPVQVDRAVLLARDALVRARTQLIHHVRGVTKAWGVQLARASTKYFAVKVRDQVPEPLRPALSPVLDTILELSERIAAYEVQLKRMAEQSYPEVSRLTQVPGVGPLTALAYRWAIRDPARFARSRQVGSYVGLAPGSRSSGQRDPELKISKEGPPMLRRLLVQCAHHILSKPGCDGALQRFGLRIAARGGKRAKKRAAVAVARKLAVLLHHLWKTGEAFVPFPEGRPVERAA